MTEQKFENAMEHFGDAVEKTAEGAAKALDKSLNAAWRFRPVRVVGKTLSFLTGAGLIASAVPLNEKGYHTAAKICLISGGVVIVAGILEMIFIRRK